MSPSGHPGKTRRARDEGWHAGSIPAAPISPWVALKPLLRGRIQTQELLPSSQLQPPPDTAPRGNIPDRGSGDVADTSRCPTSPCTSTSAPNTSVSSPVACPRGSDGTRPRWVGGGHGEAPPGADPPVSLHRGVVRVDIELRDVTIDQCASGPGWFADTHRCDLNSTQVSAAGTRHPVPHPLAWQGWESPAPNRPYPPGRAVPAECPSLRAELYPLPADPSASFSCSQHRSRGVYCANLPSPLPVATCDLAAPCPGIAGTAGLQGAGSQ